MCARAADWRAGRRHPAYKKKKKKGECKSSRRIPRTWEAAFWCAASYPRRTAGGRPVRVLRPLRADRRSRPNHNHDVRPHPHIGLATVTYLFEGAMLHRDSTGVVQRDRAGRDQLDDGRARHRAFGAHARRICAPRSTQPWPAAVGRHCPLADEELAPSFSAHPAADHPALQGRRRGGAGAGRRGLRRGVAGGDASPTLYLFDIALRARPPRSSCRRRRRARALCGRRRRSGSTARRSPQSRWPCCPKARRRRCRRREADARGADRRRAARPALHVVELRLQPRERIIAAEADWAAQRFAQCRARPSSFRCRRVAPEGPAPALRGRRISTLPATARPAHPGQRHGPEALQAIETTSASTGVITPRCRPGPARCAAAASGSRRRRSPSPRARDRPATATRPAPPAGEGVAQDRADHRGRQRRPRPCPSRSPAERHAGALRLAPGCRPPRARRRRGEHHAERRWHRRPAGEFGPEDQRDAGQPEQAADQEARRPRPRTAAAPIPVSSGEAE